MTAALEKPGGAEGSVENCSSEERYTGPHRACRFPSEAGPEQEHSIYK